MPDKGWQRSFDDPIPLPNGRRRDDEGAAQEYAEIGAGIAPQAGQSLQDRAIDRVNPCLITPAVGAYLENDRAGPLDRKPRLPEMRKDWHRPIFASERAGIP